MTQLILARQGVITPEMVRVAIRENQTPEFIRDCVARGTVVIPANIRHLAGAGGSAPSGKWIEQRDAWMKAHAARAAHSSLSSYSSSNGNGSGLPANGNGRAANGNGHAALNILSNGKPKSRRVGPTSGGYGVWSETSLTDLRNARFPYDDAQAGHPTHTPGSAYWVNQTVTQRRTWIENANHCRGERAPKHLDPTGIGRPITTKINANQGASISFGAIWMSAAMDLNHPESKRAKKLHSFAAGAMERALRLNLSLSPQFTELAAALALNKAAMTTLRETLPKANKIKPAYVHARSTKTELRLPLKGASISVLGPEKDIDFYYLGKEGDPSLRRLGFIDGLPDPATAVPDPDTIPMPANIDPADFQRLRSRMLSTALAFADLDGKVCNNTSVILLIEWKGKRLLFVGDAEWDGAYKEGKGNCAWNVMWNLRKEKLKGPLAFYKIGHHGSVNATPWGMTAAASKGEPLAILDAILPERSKAKAKAIVSTRRGNYETIPRTDLLAEIGRRVSNTKNYAAAFKKAGKKTSEVPKFGDFEKKSFAKPQPLRTDLERMLQESKGFVDVEIEP